MCVAESECAPGSCVAGRCVAAGTTPQIASARRLVIDPVDVACVRRGDRAGDSLPATAALGRDAAVAFVRFAVDLPAEASVLEAYLVLSRASDVDADPAPLALHAARVVDPWDGRSISWANQPRIQEVGAPVTHAYPASGALVRLDVGDLVRRWRKREPGRDFGIAVVAEAQSAGGMSFALTPAGDARGPRLELYVK